ncbi:MAG TPA: hypothetical protein VNZ57_14685 [Longimicrobiales bacterium]|nr:hypothetical protein [Longimicrobiales bacterium]
MLLATVAVVVAPLTALAQQPDPLQPGDHIRVHSEEIVHFRIRGDIVDVRPDGILLRPSGAVEPRFLSSGFITRIEKRTGNRRATLDGTLLGALAGLLTGVAVIGIAEADDRIDPTCGRSHCYGKGLYVATTAAGAAIGALAGFRLRLPVWERVQLSVFSVE